MHSMHDITVTFLRHVSAWQFINLIHFTLIYFRLYEYSLEDNIVMLQHVGVEWL